MFYVQKLNKIEGTIAFNDHKYNLDKEQAYQMAKELHLKSKGAIVIDYSMCSYGIIKVFLNPNKHKTLSIENALEQTIQHIRKAL